MAKFIVLCALLVAAGASGSGLTATPAKLRLNFVEAQKRAQKQLLKYLPGLNGRKLEEDEDDMDPEAMCQFLVDGTGPMAESMGEQGAMSANEDGTTQTFCSMPASSITAMATMSADDEAADPSAPAQCDSLPTLHDFLCKGMCSTECRTSTVLSDSSANDDGSGSSDTDLDVAAMCTDTCLPIMLNSMVAMLEKTAECEGTGEDTELPSSGGDEASGDDGASGNDESDPMAALDQFEFLCVQNSKGAYCIQHFMDMDDGMDSEEGQGPDICGLMITDIEAGCAAGLTAGVPCSATYGEGCPDKVKSMTFPAGVTKTTTFKEACGDIDGCSEGSLATSCEDPSMIAMVDGGCCFASMMLAAAWKDESELTIEDAEMEMAVLEFGKCGGSMRPCSQGAVLDVAVVESSISFDGIGEEYFEVASNRKVVRQTIASELSTGTSVVTSQQVLITGFSSTARRQLSGSTTVNYQVTLKAADTTKTAAVVAKIESSLDPTAFQTGGLAAVTVTPSTTVEVQTITAVPAMSTTTAESSGVSTGVIVGVVIGVLAFVAIVAMIAMCSKGKKGSGDATPEAGSVAQTKVVAMRVDDNV